MLIAVFQVVLCALLVVVPEAEASEGTENARYPRGLGSVIDKIMRPATLIYAKNQKNVYRKPGGYAQAMKDFKDLVPIPAGTKGATRWGNAGDKQVHLQNQFGKAALSIRNKESNGDVTINVIQYY